jgi:hypothetical protein
MAWFQPKPVLIVQNWFDHNGHRFFFTMVHILVYTYCKEAKGIMYFNCAHWPSLPVDKYQ